MAPCSESIKSISIEEHLSPGRCQVCSSVTRKNLHHLVYLVINKPNEMRLQVTSICVMENEIYIGTTWGCIVVAERESLRPVTVFRPYQEEVSAMLVVPVKANDRPALVTVGRGYRSLINRYKNENSKNISLFDGTFAILWSSGHWAA